MWEKKWLRNDMFKQKQQLKKRKIEEMTMRYQP